MTLHFHAVIKNDRILLCLYQFHRTYSSDFSHFFDKFAQHFIKPFGLLGVTANIAFNILFTYKFIEQSIDIIIAANDSTSYLPGLVFFWDSIILIHSSHSHVGDFSPVLGPFRHS